MSGGFEIPMKTYSIVAMMLLADGNSTKAFKLLETAMTQAKPQEVGTSADYANVLYNYIKTYQHMNGSVSDYS